MAETVAAGIARLSARLRVLRAPAAGEGRGAELDRLVERARRGQTPEPELGILARDLGVVLDTGVTRGPWPWDGGGHTAAEIYGCPTGRCAALLQCARARCRRAPVRPRRGPTIQSGRKDPMMSAFLGELGKRLAEMWLTVLVLPGLLFTGVAVLAWTLGHAHALDVGFLLSEAAWRSRLVQSAGATAVLLAVLGALLAAAGSVLAANAIAAPVRAAWLGRWPRLLDPLRRSIVDRRLARWQRLQSSYAEQVDRPDPDRVAIDALAARRNRIALAPPSQPTWIGDRIAATDRRVFTEYGLDLTSAWPRLWLTMPDAVRAELKAARTAFDAATTTAGWGILYLLLGLLWWPAAVAGAGALLAAWRRGRIGAGELAELAESTVDLHGGQLGAALGLCPADARLTRDLGGQITALLRKGS